MGDVERAAAEYGRCLALANDVEARGRWAKGQVSGDPRTCMAIATDAASRVAITGLHYRALRRSGRHNEAGRLLNALPDAADFSNTAASHEGSLIRPHYHNQHYWDTLLMYRGRKTEEDVLGRWKEGEQWTTFA